MRDYDHPDESLIGTQPHELRFWARRFGCEVARLRAAIEAVGRDAERVRLYLMGLPRRRRQLTPPPDSGLSSHADD